MSLEIHPPAFVALGQKPSLKEQAKQQNKRSCLLLLLLQTNRRHRNARTTPESITITDVNHILYGHIDNDRYWSTLNPMELMLGDARERHQHLGHDIKPPPLENDNDYKDDDGHEAPDNDNDEMQPDNVGENPKDKTEANRTQAMQTPTDPPGND
ncbi:hypothetical protein R1sor_009865 [Riccia sorocarpa]|uniref:Uncharacterized protein n=1 Tax=Riccia sorocarpa TaxID=122646 RepID=A0ABD3HZQ4_9MARC